ncbi:MAG: glycosyltransferase, partial [Terracidiphilus sp.]
WQPNAFMRRQTRAELGIGDRFLWLAAGRLELVKDYPSLLNAFARTRRPSRLVILGAGPLKAQLKQMTEALGMSGRVHFAGFQSHVAHWMQAADGVVLTSRYEGLPMVLLEAGACGVPAVATDVAGTREVIVQDETGWLTPAGDPESLAAAMDRLVCMPAKDRRELGERARRHAIRNFSMETVLDRWEALYADLLERKEAARRSGPTPWESRLRRRSAHSA